jgi:hypothetical protein
MLPGPCGGPRASASGMFLHRLLGSHLHRSSSRFDPRAHVGPPRLYKETPAPLRHQVIWRLSHPELETLIPQSSSSSRALASYIWSRGRQEDLRLDSRRCQERGLV